MKILITGGNGFIARNLVEQLGSNYEMVSMNSKELNLLDPKKVFDFIKENKFNVIIHTATYDAVQKDSTKDPAKVLEKNLRMFFNLVRCEDYFDKMIYFGSGAEYNRENWIPKMKEDYFDQHVPEDQYGLSKYIMTKYALSHDKIYNLRLFAVFGKYDDWKTRFIPNACSQAVLNIPMRINQNAFYDYLCVNDLIKIVKRFIDNKPKSKVYNVCSGEVYDRKSLAERIIMESGKNSKITIEKEGWAREYSGDNSLLLNEIGGFSFTPIDESIKALCGFYRKFIQGGNLKNVDKCCNSSI